MNIKWPHCRYCGAWTGFYFQAPDVCAFCSSRLDELVREASRPHWDLGFPCRALFEWNIASDPHVRTIVYGLKGASSASSWRVFARALLEDFRLPPATILVPIPSSLSERPAHAHGLACALSELTSVPMADVLRSGPATAVAQKRLRRADRLVRQFHNTEEFCRTYKDVTFVDDVCTTGASLKAAYTALNRPRRARALCLIRRPFVVVEGPTKFA